MQNLRIKAAQILQSVLEEKIFFGELKKQLSEKDLPFVNMLMLTTLRRYEALQVVLASFLSKKIPNKHRFANYLLILAIAELLFMQTAPYAVINETVANIRKTTDKFLGGLANAVLRKVLAQKNDLLQKIENHNLIPQNFLPILQGYDNNEIKQIAQSIVTQPPLDLTVRQNPEEWAQKLQGTLLPNGSIRLFNNPKVQDLIGYNDGAWWVQDVAASLPVQILGADLSGKKVLDLCAAPGGKTAQLAARSADVRAIDISAERLQTLRQNMQRLKFSKIKTQAIDALDFLQTTSEKFDIILLDAPCSATGTFRRHPEVLYLKTLADVEEQAKLQKKLLNAAVNVLKKDGVLVYSVCSISKIEGEYQITEFLQNQAQMQLEKIEKTDISSYGKWNEVLITAEGTIRTLPNYFAAEKGMDSFFICKMKRII